MHKKFEINRTKIKGGCQPGSKVVTLDSKSDLPLMPFKSLPKVAYVGPDPAPMRSSGHGLLNRKHDRLHSKYEL